LLSRLSIAGSPADIEDMGTSTGNLRLLGWLLLAGAAVTLGLHALEAFESLYRWLYHYLLSGLDLPEDPPRWGSELISTVELIGGVVQLAAGLALIAYERLRPA
jgi:hypothetical protein